MDSGLGSFGFLAIGILHVTLGAMLFSFQALARDFVDAGGAQQADAIVASVRAITPMLDILFPAGAMGLALGVIAYGALLVRTAALPRWIGWVGIVAGIILPLGWLAFVNENLEVLSIIGLMVGLVFVLAMGSWLLVTGTERTAPELRGA